MRKLSVLALLVCTALGSNPHATAAAEDAPEVVLRSMGLRLNGKMFLLDAEKEVVERARLVQEARALLAEAANQCAAINEADANLAATDARRQDLTRFIDACYIRMDSVNPDADSRQAQTYRDAQDASIRARAERQGLDVKSDQLRRALPSFAQRRTIQGEYDRRAFEHAVRVKEAVELIGPTTRAYSDLARSPAVAKALADLRTSSGVPYKIGPSFPYLQAVREVGMQAPTVKRSKGMVKTKGR